MSPLESWLLVAALFTGITLLMWSFWRADRDYQRLKDEAARQDAWDRHVAGALLAARHRHPTGRDLELNAGAMYLAGLPCGDTTCRVCTRRGTRG